MDAGGRSPPNEQPVASAHVARSASATCSSFYIVTTFSLRWIATAAAAGPSALVIWVIAAVGLFVPLVFATLELSSRYPEEGGVYVWSKRAFGPFAGVYDRLVVLGHEPAVLSRRCCISPPANAAVRRRAVVAGVVGEQRLFHRPRGRRPDGRRRAQRRRVEHRQVAQQRRRNRRLDSAAC